MFYICFMELQEAKNQFIHSWGMLGSSWGINKVMGQIHALLLIAPQPLTTDEIMEELHISRGNANMNIRALLDWGIIYKVYNPGSRKDHFKSEKDILELARQVTLERQKREIEPVLKMLNQVKTVQATDKMALKEFKKVTSDIEAFTLNLNKMLNKFTRSDQHWFYRKLMKLFT